MTPNMDNRRLKKMAKNALKLSRRAQKVERMLFKESSVFFERILDSDLANEELEKTKIRIIEELDDIVDYLQAVNGHMSLLEQKVMTATLKEVDDLQEDRE